MAGKRKSDGMTLRKKDGDFANKKKKSKSFVSDGKNKNRGGKSNRPRRGPGLPNVMRKEIDRLNPTSDAESSDDSDKGDLFQDDVYEFEEDIAEEESKKNRRFDRVENYQFELPEDFEVYICLYLYISILAL